VLAPRTPERPNGCEVVGAMFGWDSLGKFLMIAGLLLLALGGLMFLVGRVPFLGRLPGDIVVERENFRFYFPLATCLLLSAVLTLIFWLLGRR
jgi:hypothetical protein